MSTLFVEKQFLLLDDVADNINKQNFASALGVYYKFAVNVQRRKQLKFDPRTGYTHEQFTGWMHTLNTELLNKRTEEALQAQSVVYEMLDVLV